MRRMLGSCTSHRTRRQEAGILPKTRGWSNSTCKEVHALTVPDGREGDIDGLKHPKELGLPDSGSGVGEHGVRDKRSLHVLADHLDRGCFMVEDLVVEQFPCRTLAQKDDLPAGPPQSLRWA